MIAPSTERLRILQCWLLCVALAPACAPRQRMDASAPELGPSIDARRSAAYLNELQQYLVMLDRSNYEGVHAMMRSSQDSELLSLCKRVACGGVDAAERDRVRRVVQRLADYRAQRGAELAPHAPEVDECIRSLVTEGGE